MRSLMLAAALSLTSLVTPSTADACGGYYSGPVAPSLFLVSSHHGEHSFVVLNQEVDKQGHDWRVLEPDSFDRAAVAPAPAFSSPIKFTLVGPSGTKQVSTSTQVFLDEPLSMERKPTAAAQIPHTSDFVVAAWGSEAGLGWKNLEQLEHTTKTKAWAKQLGVELTSAWATRSDDVDMLSFRDHNGKIETHVRQRGSFVGSMPGSALGMITADGARYAVIVDGNRVQTIPVSAATAKARR